MVLLMSFQAVYFGHFLSFYTMQLEPPKIDVCTVRWLPRLVYLGPSLVCVLYYGLGGGWVVPRQFLGGWVSHDPTPPPWG